ncbi:MAG: gamma-glutamyl-gamma-aminobutyrate hydrolase family protein [Proteobacteria bacterium]|nr:gamma-glutamyl-gamma-aminobutyrate hydrolase family protein [Pseudomonadota bacterium]MBI3497187.1 gamma-glutamyl-gamma-aminobutyrate hydrolase family protein [Pseudomonadota bacterium]
MRPVAISQRVDIVPRRGERRDALDQRWVRLLAACGLLAVPMPNEPDLAAELFQDMEAAGLVLTGGNDLVRYGGDAPERDRTEQLLLRLARKRALPILGVCRGMQVIQDCFGVTLKPVSGHVATRHAVDGAGLSGVVNSYHGYGASETSAELGILARAADGVVEAIGHRAEPILAQMWHPERETPFDPADLARIRGHFGIAP